MRVYHSIALLLQLHHALGGDYIRIQNDADLTVSNNHLIKSSYSFLHGDQQESNVDITQQDPSEECKCVTCGEDEICGGLWRGSKYKNYGKVDLDAQTIHVVVAHCRSPSCKMEFHRCEH